MMNLTTAMEAFSVVTDTDIVKLSESLQIEHSYRQSCELAEHDPLRFWGALARSYLCWQQPFKAAISRVSASDERCLWFEGGLTNLTLNCLDRHCRSGRGDQRALIWKGDDESVRTFTYDELLREVCHVSDALRRSSIEKGHVVAVYMPLLPEAIFTILACNRIGAIPCPLYSGLSGLALGARLIQTEAQLLVTANGTHRNNRVVSLRKKVLQAKGGISKPLRVVEVLRIQEQPCREMGWIAWDEWIDGACSDVQPEEMEATSTAFMIHTSGTTGKPKQVEHHLGGALLASHVTTRWCFNAQAGDVLWCTADLGWITSMAHVIYGPLSNGLTTVIYEGSILSPERHVPWKMIERYQVNKWKTAPTAIRALRREEPDPRRLYDLSSLDVVFSSGEPLDISSRGWIQECVLGNKGSVVDGWGQTETCSTMICPIPGASVRTQGSVGRPLPGAHFQIATDPSNTETDQGVGYLKLVGAWPGLWFEKSGVSTDRPLATGDVACKHQDGSITILGRHDEVVNVSGHRISTAEVELAVKRHSAIEEVAAVGRPHEIKGQVIATFVTLSGPCDDSDRVEREVYQMVVEHLGVYAAPTDIFVVKELPRTHSGKVAKGYLMKLAAQEHITTQLDNSMIQNVSALAELENEALHRDNY